MAIRVDAYYWNDLGVSYARQADFTNAFEAHSNAFSLRERLIQIQPTNLAWLGAYGSTACNLGQDCRHLHRIGQAGDYLHKAENVFRQWLAAEPSSTLPKRRLATVLGAIGNLASERGQFDEADRAYASNLELARQAVRNDPESAEPVSDLMIALNYAGETQTLKSNYVAAVATLAESVKLGDQLLARDAANREWRMFLTTVLIDQGAALHGAQRPQEALASFRRAWTLCEEQADAVRQSPHWTSAWRDALEQGEQLERELAAQAEVAGLAEAARYHQSEAEKLETQLRTFARGK